MSKGFKFFLITFLISLPFCWGTNLLEKNLKDFFFLQKIAQDPQILTAQLNQILLEEKLEILKPLPNKTAENLNIQPKSGISVLVKLSGQEKTLFEKDKNKILPIASLTKLMTAKIVLENYELEEIITISEKAVAIEGDSGEFKIGETFKIKDLLYSLLMESSNDAAFALSEVIGKKSFVNLMNFEAESLGLQNTYFADCMGLDPKIAEGPINYSTVEDLAKFTNYLLKNPLIWEISGTKEFDLYDANGIFHHQIKNTNKLLESVVWQAKIIGGKTGWTPRAGDCLLLVVKAPKSQGYLINIILGSEDRFGEMEQLLNWGEKAYKW